MDQNIKKAHQKKTELIQRVAFIDNEVSDLQSKIESLKMEKWILAGKIDLLNEIFWASIPNEKLNKITVTLEKNAWETTIDKILMLLQKKWPMLSRDIANTLLNAWDVKSKNDVHNEIKKLIRYNKIYQTTEYNLDGSIRLKNTPYALTLK